MEGERSSCKTFTYVALFTVGQFAPDRPPLTYVMLSAGVLGRGTGRDGAWLDGEACEEVWLRPAADSVTVAPCCCCLSPKTLRRRHCHTLPLFFSPFLTRTPCYFHLFTYHREKRWMPGCVSRVFHLRFPGQH